MRLKVEINYKFSPFEYSYRDVTGKINGNININKILSNGHTARGILVYVFRNWLKFQEKQEWIVKIDNTGALVLYNKSESKEYLFHAVKNRREIEGEIRKYRDLDIPRYFFAVLDQFETSQTVKFYEVLA